MRKNWLKRFVSFFPELLAKWKYKTAQGRYYKNIGWMLNDYFNDKGVQNTWQNFGKDLCTRTSELEALIEVKQNAGKQKEKY